MSAKDGFGGEHRCAVQEPVRNFCDDAGANLPVTHCTGLSGGRVSVKKPLVAAPISMPCTWTVTKRKNRIVSKWRTRLERESTYGASKALRSLRDM